MSSVCTTHQAPALATTPVASPSPDDLPIDADIPEDYIKYTLKKEKPLPPVTWANLLHELNWTNVSLMCVPPLIGAVGMCYTPLRRKTALFSVLYYFITGLSEHPVFYHPVHHN